MPKIKEKGPGTREAKKDASLENQTVEQSESPVAAAWGNRPQCPSQFAETPIILRYRARIYPLLKIQGCCAPRPVAQDLPEDKALPGGARIGLFPAAFDLRLRCYVHCHPLSRSPTAVSPPATTRQVPRSKKLLACPGKGSPVLGWRSFSFVRPGLPYYTVVMLH